MEEKNFALDFRALFGAENKAAERRESQGMGPTIDRDEKDRTEAAEAATGETEQAIDLLRIYNERTEAQERARQVYAEYQNNIRSAGDGRRAIIQGLQAGQDVEALFLQAAEVIGRLTGDSDFPRRVKSELLTIYGAGLAENKARRMQREAVQERLQKLTEAAGRETDPGELQRINGAIKAHQAALDRLSGVIQAAG